MHSGKPFVAFLILYFIYSNCKVENTFIDIYSQNDVFNKRSIPIDTRIIGKCSNSANCAQFK